MENKILLINPADALLNPSVLRMIEAEGMRGCGIYFALLAFITQSGSLSVPLSKLGSLALRIGTRPHLLKRIATLYQLFTVKNDRIYAPDQIRTQAETVPSRVDNTVEQVLEPTVELPVEPRVEQAVEPTVEPRTEPAKPTRKRLKANKKRTSTPSRPHVRTRTSVVDDNNIISDNIINNNIKNACIRASTGQAPLPPPDELACLALVDTLAADETWLDKVWPTTELAKEHRTHLPQIVEAFKTHIQAFGKEDELPTLRSVRRYFLNFVASDCRTGRRLREQITVWQEAARAANPYRYEVLIDGRRTYMGGCPIPDDAPPRPTLAACWDSAYQMWRA